MKESVEKLKLESFSSIKQEVIEYFASKGILIDENDLVKDLENNIQRMNDRIEELKKCFDNDIEYSPSSRNCGDIEVNIDYSFDDLTISNTSKSL